MFNQNRIKAEFRVMLILIIYLTHPELLPGWTRRTGDSGIKKKCIRKLLLYALFYFFWSDTLIFQTTNGHSVFHICRKFVYRTAVIIHVSRPGT